MHCVLIQVRFVYQTKSEILTYCTGKITKFYKAIYITILNELCNSIINCRIGTLTEGKYLERWCLLGMELTSEGGDYYLFFIHENEAI